MPEVMTSVMHGNAKRGFECIGNDNTQKNHLGRFGGMLFKH